jgi:hypothetical protein
MKHVLQVGAEKGAVLKLVDDRLDRVERIRDAQGCIAVHEVVLHVHDHKGGGAKNYLFSTE